MAEIVFAPVCSYCGGILFNRNILLGHNRELLNPTRCPYCDQPFSMFLGTKKYNDVTIWVGRNGFPSADPTLFGLDIKLEVENNDQRNIILE